MHLFHFYAHAQNVRCLFRMHCIMLMLLLLAITLCLAVCHVDSTEIDFVLPTKLSYKVANNLPFFSFSLWFFTMFVQTRIQIPIKGSSAQDQSSASGPRHQVLWACSWCFLVSPYCFYRRVQTPLWMHDAGSYQQFACLRKNHARSVNDNTSPKA